MGISPCRGTGLSPDHKVLCLAGSGLLSPSPEAPAVLSALRQGSPEHPGTVGLGSQGEGTVLSQPELRTHGISAGKEGERRDSEDFPDLRDGMRGILPALRAGGVRKPQPRGQPLLPTPNKFWRPSRSPLPESAGRGRSSSREHPPVSAGSVPAKGTEHWAWSLRPGVQGKSVGPGAPASSCRVGILMLPPYERVLRTDRDAKLMTFTVWQRALSKNLLNVSSCDRKQASMCPARSGACLWGGLPHQASNTVGNEGGKGKVLGNFSSKWFVKGPAWPRVPDAVVPPLACTPGTAGWPAENNMVGLTQGLETTQALPGILGSEFRVRGRVTQHKKRAAWA